LKKSIGFLKYALKMVLVKGEWFDLYPANAVFDSISTPAMLNPKTTNFFFISFTSPYTKNARPFIAWRSPHSFSTADN